MSDVFVYSVNKLEVIKYVDLVLSICFVIKKLIEILQEDIDNSINLISVLYSLILNISQYDFTQIGKENVKNNKRY